MTQDTLRAYRSIKREREQLRQKLEEIEAALLAPKVQRLTGMPSNPTTGNPQESLALRHIELQELYRTKMDELYYTQLKVEEAIDRLDPTLRTLLRYRYIDGLKWEEICVKMSYGWTQTHALHRIALRKLKENTE